MKKQIFIKSIIVGIVVLIPIIGVGVMQTTASDTNEEQKYQEHLIKYAQGVREHLELQDILSDDSIISDMFRMEKINESGDASKEEALDSAMEYIIEREAMFAYATSLGYSTTEREVEEFIENELVEMKKAENYSEIEAAHKAAGTTLKEGLYAAKASKIKERTIDKYYKEEKERYLKSNPSGLETTENNDSLWDKKWDSIVKKIIAKYKTTAEYRELRKDLVKSGNIIKNNDDVEEFSSVANEEELVYE